MALPSATMAAIPLSPSAYLVTAYPGPGNPAGCSNMGPPVPIVMQGPGYYPLMPVFPNRVVIPPPHRPLIFDRAIDIFKQAGLQTDHVSLIDLTHREWLHLRDIKLPPSYKVLKDVARDHFYDQTSTLGSVYFFNPDSPNLFPHGSSKKITRAVRVVFDNARLIDVQLVLRLEDTGRIPRVFKSEAQFLANASKAGFNFVPELLDAHPGCFDDAVEVTGRLYMFMKLCTSDLSELINYTIQGLGLHIPTLPQRILYLLTAINQLHYQGIVHNDLKLENTLLSFGSKQLVVADFGSMGPDGVGTTVYNPPEDYLGNRPQVGNVGRDIWCLGGLFLELINQGDLPWKRAITLLNGLNKLLRLNVGNPEHKLPTLEDEEQITLQVKALRERVKQCDQALFNRLASTDPQKETDPGLKQLFRDIRNIIQKLQAATLSDSLGKELFGLRNECKTRIVNMWQFFDMDYQENIRKDPKEFEMITTSVHPYFEFEVLAREIVRRMLRFRSTDRPSIDEILKEFGARLNKAIIDIDNATIQHLQTIFAQKGGQLTEYLRKKIMDLYSVMREQNRPDNKWVNFCMPDFDGIQLPLRIMPKRFGGVICLLKRAGDQRLGRAEDQDSWFVIHMGDNCLPSAEWRYNLDGLEQKEEKKG